MKILQKVCVLVIMFVTMQGCVKDVDSDQSKALDENELELARIKRIVDEGIRKGGVNSRARVESGFYGDVFFKLDPSRGDAPASNDHKAQLIATCQNNTNQPVSIVLGQTTLDINLVQVGTLGSSGSAVQSSYYIDWTTNANRIYWQIPPEPNNTGSGAPYHVMFFTVQIPGSSQYNSGGWAIWMSSPYSTNPDSSTDFSFITRTY